MVENLFPDRRSLGRTIYQPKDENNLQEDGRFYGIYLE